MTVKENKKVEKGIVYTSRITATISILFVVCGIVFCISFFWTGNSPSNLVTNNKLPATGWSAPDDSSIPNGEDGEMIRYGKDLIIHTGRYFGPNGSVAKISNGMNCQNCHLKGGTKIFANNYSVFLSGYPKVSARSGRNDPPSERIADCFERSLNGTAPNSEGKEVKAMLAYMKWVGEGVKKGEKVFGTSSQKLMYLKRAADPVKGELVYLQKCTSCHGTSGEGVLSANKDEYTYPPLWGLHSYNDGAGLFRLSNFAGFVKNNMPFGTSYPNAQLSDEEAWDVAAFVNSQPRPHKDQSKDYPDLNKKPVDSPFGPYADSFTEKQHKFGPFAEIAAFQKK
ncbi:c-type cytochrome [Pedobacter sp. Du54]|uniref:c-type cytochrome n=1 Tax=Pedobacter anseongensis TaxID=3133439 RepID=UPI0030AABE7A